MSGFKGMMKDGWHPKNESWRGDFKGINQVAGLMGKGKETGDRDVSEHVSQPLSSLKDPSSFGPPPKNRVYYGADSASSPSIPAQSGSGASSFSQTRAQGQNHQLGQQQTERDERPEKPAPPAVPYRADRTGLSTSNLPPPPRRMDSPADSAPPINSQSRPVPALPPRVPPRKDPSPPPAYTPIEPSEPSDGYINQGATSRLAQRGVSVPSLGIGKDGNSPGTGSPTTTSSGRNAVNDLQSRFSKMRTNSPSSSGPPPPPSRGTSTAEKQAALRTAQNAHRDPSSVSASDARSAASTVNNFRERHGDQIKAGKDKISGINQKYGISKKFNSFVDEHKPGASTSQARPPPPPSNPNLDRPASTRKKAPPPPPPKKAEMRASPVNASPSSPAPPPLPLSTKPR